MKKKRNAQLAFLNIGASLALLILGATACSVLSGALLAFFRTEAHSGASPRALTFADRVAAQRAIEEIYWRHRIWPTENSKPKPSLDEVMSHAQLEKKVTNYLRKSQALQNYWHQPITAEQLQTEMDRMAQHTKQPEVLRELFEALGNDPFVVAECLARPILTERLVAAPTVVAGVPPAPRSLFAADTAGSTENRINATNLNKASYTLPAIDPCTDDTWTTTSVMSAPDGRSLHAVVWTGSEMIVWGGVGTSGFLNTGGRYNPSTDTWAATSTTNAPVGRDSHTAVWTGSEMIVWGGFNDAKYVNTGGRYNPSTDSWTATSTTNTPSARFEHTAVWTGTEMIVWGGFDGSNDVNTGGRYNPSTDSWTTTSTANAPVGREAHTAVWAGSDMIAWGGADVSYFNTGGRYNPGTDSWTLTSTTNAPAARSNHAAVWTGSEMIVWGGFNGSQLNTGGRYNPSTDGWTVTSITNAPAPRYFHTMVWTGSEMIVWGGIFNLNTGGRYCAQSGAPSPTPTATPTPTSAPCSVDSSNLGCGGTINFQPTEFSIDVTCPVDPATVHPSSFTVNNIQPDSFTILNGNLTIRFHYNTTPVVQGLNTMHIPAGGFNCACGPVAEFTCTFTYQPSTPTPTPTATATATPVSPTPTVTATPTATPTFTPRPSPTPRVPPTPRPHFTPAPRP